MALRVWPGNRIDFYFGMAVYRAFAWWRAGR
jgi:hypothetical protein